MNPIDHEVGGLPPERLVLYDLALIYKCDILLLNAGDPSWGSAMELFYAWRMGKKTVVFNLPDPASPWLLGHTTVQALSLTHACELIRNPND